METVINVSKVNETFIRLNCSDSGALEEISEAFTFEVPSAKFTPLFKQGLWDGKVRLFNRRSNQMYSGLFDRVKQFGVERGYNVVQTDSGLNGDIFGSEVVDLSFMNVLNLSAAGEKIEPKDYQLDGILHALSRKRCILISPTGSGKSLMIYAMIRKMLFDNPESKILITVPTVSLTKQMTSDFLDYASNDPSFKAEYIHQISAGKEKNSSAPITVSTWQSIFKQPRSYFDQFTAIIGDEAHLCAAKSLSGIMEMCGKVKYRIGLTGTIDPKSPVNPLTLEGLFGPIHRVTWTKTLMNNGTLAEIDIKMLQLKYSKEVCKAVKSVDYQAEIDWIVTNPARTEFIANLAVSQKKNTLVLFNFVEKHGQVLFDLICAKVGPNRKVFYIHGGVAGDEREGIRKEVESLEDAIIVASAGVFSTGVNVRNLYSIIFTSPMKSFQRVLQSVGRGLRKHGEGKKLKLYDIIDDLAHGKKKNFALLHGIERMRIYTKEGFPMKTHVIDLN